MPINLGALLGGNQGQGGAVAPLLAAAQRHKQAQTDAAAFQALQQMAQQNQGSPASLPGSTPLPAPGGAPGQAPPQQPGGLASPQGGPVPISRPAPPQGAAPAPGGAPPPTPAPGAGPAQQPSPRGDMFAMVDKVAALKIPDDQKMAVLQKMGAFTAPIEKYTQQLEMAQTKLSAQQAMLEEKQRTLVLLQQMRDSTSRANTGDRVSATEGNTDERVRHDKALESNAAKRTDVAATNSGSRVQLDKARIKELENRVPKEDKKAFTAAKDKYDKAASLYQSLTRPGATPAPNPADVAFAKKKMDDAEQTMTSMATGSPASSAGTKQVDPSLITPENLQHTADKYGITVDEVKKRLGVQ